MAFTNSYCIVWLLRDLSAGQCDNCPVTVSFSQVIDCEAEEVILLFELITTKVS